MKRRFLALGDAAVRHSFRARLVPACRPVSAQDVRQFLLAYCACFLAIMLYIA
jgi:hypothetical protein